MRRGGGKPSAEAGLPRQVGLTRTLDVRARFGDTREMRRVWLYGPALAWAGLIFWLSHQSRLPEAPGGDKVAHLLAYAVMGGVFARPLWFDTRRTPGHVFSSAALLAVLYGLSDELHQSFVPGRDASVGDAVADAVGALLGAAMWVLGCRVLGRFTSRVRRDTRPG